MTQKTWDEVRKHASTPALDFFQVGDEVRLVSGKYGASQGNLPDHNPLGCVRKVVGVYEDDKGNRRVWVQLKLPWAKRNNMEGCVSPYFDQLAMHRRAKKNMATFVLMQMAWN